MTDSSRLEDLVADFLDAREDHPELEPAAFAVQHLPEDADRLVEAIEATLQALHAMSDAAPLEQKRIGAYRILGEVGRGGMGIVYEAERSGNRYAIKLIPFAPLGDARATERFRREIRGLARLDHPNIVAIHDAGLQDGAPYIVMEYVDGQSLASISKDLSTRRAAEIARTLALAAESAHERGVIHRDIKPQNVLLRRDGSPVLLDFGLMTAEDLPGLTETGDFVGTPRYMPPERIRGEPAEPRTDVYGLGMVLYELLVGRPAFSQQSRETILRAVERGTFPAPRSLRSGIERDLERIVLTALAHEPKRRYPSARALAADLGRFLEGEPIRARPPGAVTRTVDRALRHPLRTAAAALVILGATTAIVWPFVTARPAPPTQEEQREADAVAARATARWLDLYDDAGTLAREARTIDPNDATAVALDAWVHERPAPNENRHPLARALYDAIAFTEADDRDELDGGSDEPIDSLDIDKSLADVLEAEPANGLALTLRGRIARREDRRLDAEEFFSGALRTLEECAYVHRSLAWLYEKSKRYDDALLRIKRAVSLKPESSRSLALLAKIHARRGSLDKGLAAIERAKNALGDREDTFLYTIEGSLLDEAGRREEARACFRKVLDADPRNSQGWFNLALSYDADHRIGEAVEAYENAVRYSRHDPDERSLTNLAHLYSGASKGTCVTCDELYAAHPEYLDLERGFEYWQRAVEADDGAESDVAPAFLPIGLRFDRDKVIAFLDRIASREPDSAQSRRNARLLRHFRMRSE